MALFPSQPIFDPLEMVPYPQPAIRAVLRVTQRIAVSLGCQFGGSMPTCFRGIPIGSVRAGDVGTVFEITILDNNGAVDVSLAPVRQIIFGKPGSGFVVKDAIFSTDGTDGRIQYSTVAGDLDQVGQWQMQGRVVLPPLGDLHTETALFNVEPVIETPYP